MNPLQLRFYPYALVILFVPSVAQADGGVHTSQLWGEAGEHWSYDSRLPDFSHAGVNRGEAPLPEMVDVPVRNVRDFGAQGDGEHDDTAAFQEALDDNGPLVVAVPAGRYVITDFIDIRRPRVVLRGAGINQTTLYFPKTLTDVAPSWGATTGGRRTSHYSWSGGFLRIRGKTNNQQPVATVAQPAARGDTELVLDGAVSLEPGDEIRLAMTDDGEQSLAHFLYAGDTGPIDNLPGQIRLSQVFRIRNVEGHRVQLDRPLRFDVRMPWQPIVHRFEPTVTHSGIEHLTLEFPANDYEGHFTELGHNGIAISDAAHCWVRDVRLKNAEGGIFLSGRFCTLTGITLDSDRAPEARGRRGHHGITLGGEDNLLTDFAFNARYIHDITVSRGSVGNVVSRGRAEDLCLDHHRRAPYENLFTEIDAGEGTRLWASGGGAALGKHAAARNTYWNIRAENPISPPPPKFAPPQINIVALTTDEPDETTAKGRWFERIDPEKIQPQNLYEAQLQRRLSSGE